MRIEVEASFIEQLSIEVGFAEQTVRNVLAALCRHGWQGPRYELFASTPERNTLVVVEGDHARASSTRALAPMPADFRLSNDTVVWTRSQLGADTEWIPVYKQFLSHHQAKGTKFKDWQAAWRTWVRREKRWGTTPTGKSPSSARAQAARVSPLP